MLKIEIQWFLFISVTFRYLLDCTITTCLWSLIGQCFAPIWKGKTILERKCHGWEAYIMHVWNRHPCSVFSINWFKDWTLHKLEPLEQTMHKQSIKRKLCRFRVMIFTPKKKIRNSRVIVLLVVDLISSFSRHLVIRQKWLPSCMDHVYVVNY